MKKQLVGEAWIKSPEKRRQDMLLANALMPVAVTIGGLSLAAVALADGRKPLFRQSRIGQDGKPFDIYKIRTMPSGDYFDSSHGVHDPRATRVGKLLRRMSLDESPQIINILKGEMTVVGPRPLIQPSIDAMQDCLSSPDFDDWFRAYCIGRPGLVSKFGNLSHAVPSQTDESYLKRAELDIQYMESASSELDAQIIREALGVSKARLGFVEHIPGDTTLND